MILTRLIGRGGMCCVFEAVDAIDGTRCAVKVLFDISSPYKLSRFRREARATAHTSHPNIVDALGAGLVPGRFAFLVLELCSGGTLQDVLRRSGPLDHRRAARLLGQVAAGVAALHASGYVHRDLKPANIMMTGRPPDETAKIIDLGIVAIPGLGLRDRQEAEENAVLGTPAYMAPELLASDGVSPAVDLYALGVILYEMLSGRPPFEGPMLQLVAQHVTQTPPPLAFHAGLGPLALQLLAKDPKARSPSAADLASMLASGCA